MSKISQTDMLKVLSEAFDAPLAELRLDTERDSIPGWDSMGALTLMAEMDERFSLQLSPDRSRKMSKIADIFTYLRENEALLD